MRFFPVTLQGKFLAGLVVILLLMGVLFGVALQAHTKQLLVAEAREKAQLMLAHTEAIQRYVREVLRPAVSKRIEADDFIIEAMSTSFVTRHVLQNITEDAMPFVFRRVAKNARNPEFEVTTAEEVLFNRFLADPKLTRIEEVIDQGDAGRLLIARPVRFTADCLRCHGLPENAPAVLLQMYGSQRGFYRQEKELVGLEVVSVPLYTASGPASRSTTMFAIWFVSGMVLLLVVIQGYFNRLVVHNLRRVGSILQRVFFREGGGELLAPLEREEDIEGMIRGIETIATHLGTAKEQLNTYAKNLESMVGERTADLEHVLAARSADVELFVRLLRDLNQHGEKKNLLCASLNHVARHFGASSAFYTCGFAGLDSLVWPGCLPPESRPQGSPVAPPLENLGQLSLRALEEPVLEENYWLLPVQTSGQSRGVYGLFWNSPAEVPGQDCVPRAMALGTQIGIALDNLEALEALLHQNTLLDSLVEGVPDPLLLMEAGGRALLANSSAHHLAARLQHMEHNQPPKNGAGAEVLQEEGRQVLLATLLERMGVTVQATHTDKVSSHEVELPGGLSFDVGIYPFIEGRGLGTRLIVHIRETTEERQLLGHLRRSEKMAAVGQLAAGIAHEINNPLGVIRCYAELLGASLPEGQEKADVETILRHVESAQTVLRDLLHFSRPKVTQAGPCDVAALLASLVELFKPKATRLGVGLVVEATPNLPLVHTDSGLLEQVLVNLLLNALDAVPPQSGQVRLMAQVPPRQADLSIHIIDNGGGVPEVNLGKLFDPFFSTKPAGHGTGLGLTVAFGMVREMKGTLEVHNRYEQGVRVGAEFIVTLPLDSMEQGHDPM